MMIRPLAYRSATNVLMALVAAGAMWLVGIGHADQGEPDPGAGAAAAAASGRPVSERRFRDNLLNGQPCAFCPEMIVLPSGDFTMGSSDDDRNHWDHFALDGRPPIGVPLFRDDLGRTYWSSQSPQHTVHVKSFAVGLFEITFEQWDACGDAGGCGRNPHPRDYSQGQFRGSFPVFDISWNDAQEYLAWLSRVTGRHYRLLTESEWEYAARAGTTQPFWWGNTPDERYGNFEGAGPGFMPTMSVGSYPPNPFGLFDMHGNVQEFVEDCWRGHYIGAPIDGTARLDGDCNTRVARGGSHYTLDGFTSSATRDEVPIDTKDPPIGVTTGFRVARSI